MRGTSFQRKRLRSRCERKNKFQTYEISNQILNLISLNWTLMSKSYMQYFDTSSTLNWLYSSSKQCLFLKVEKKIVRQGVNSHVGYRVFQNLRDVVLFFFLVDRKRSRFHREWFRWRSCTLRGQCTLFHRYEYCSRMTRQKQLGTLAKVAFPVY